MSVRHLQYNTLFSALTVTKLYPLPRKFTNIANWYRFVTVRIVFMYATVNTQIKKKGYYL